MTRKEQKEERRKAILMTALTLFVENGYHETRISDIAQAVPMSTGLLFHYFESKVIISTMKRSVDQIIPEKEIVDTAKKKIKHDF